MRSKQPRIQSPAIRRAAEGRACTIRSPVCNHDPATTVLAHIRIPGHAGVGMKPHDLFGVFACSRCHDALDRRTGAVQPEDVLRALIETQTILLVLGLIRVD